MVSPQGHSLKKCIQADEAWSFRRCSFFFKLLTVQTRYVVHMTSCIVVLLQAYIPKKSVLYVDLTDTEQNNIDDAFGMMHEKVHTTT